MKKNVLKKALALFLCMLFVLSSVACGSGSDANTGDNNSSNGGSNSGGNSGSNSSSGEKTVVWGCYDSQQSLDNFGSGTTTVWMRIAQLFEDHLFDSNHDGTYEPWIATDWEWSDDYLTLTVNIRDDVYFHSGDKLTAEDVAFTYNRPIQYMEDHITSTTLVGFLNNAEATSDTQVVFHFDVPTYSFFSDSCNAFGIINKSAWEEDPNFWEHPDGSGPYLLDSFDSSTSVFEFTRWDEWWGWKEGHTTNVDHIIYRGITDTTSRMSALRAHECDIVDDVPLDQIEMIGAEGFSVGTYFRDRPYFFGIQCGEQSVFHDVRMREALFLCIDRDALVGSIVGGGSAADWPVSPTMMGYDATKASYEYNVEKAKQLVQEAGYDGREVVYITSNVIHAHAAEIAQALQAWCAAIGINLTIQMTEVASYNAARKDGQYDICIGGSPTKDGDPGSIVKGYMYEGMQRNNGYDNPELRALAAKAMETVDDAERNELYKQCFAFVNSDYFNISLFNAEEGWAMNPKLSGIGIVNDAMFDMRWMHLDD